MPSAPERAMSLREFLAWEREQPERYEFADGIVTMRAGQTLGHCTITTNLLVALRQRLRGSGCRVFVTSVKIIADETVRYPDVSVTCVAVNGKDDIVPDPVVVIEIVAPSTERID